MLFTPTRVRDAWLIEPQPSADERGLFARTWCAREFAARGLDTRLAQCAVSFNTRAGTLRGIHYQAAPHEEVKLVRCTAGSIFDVVVDLREGSPTFGMWAAAELSATNRRMFYVPAGCGHGYLTLEDGAEVFYQISTEYSPESARGVRWDDPAFAIDWPLPVRVISARDRTYPLVTTRSAGARR
jgi:dTDP-4-dehydrorhamnose 3,5-epimerase